MAEIDGLGRLCAAGETISNTSGIVDFSYDFVYDMRSQLKQVDIDKNSSPYWNAEYNYRKDGNLDSKQVQTDYSTFTYDGDLLLSASTSSPQDGLVGHWKMDDNAPDTTVLDSSGCGNDGTFNDPTDNPNTNAHHTTGKINGALTFDGTDDYVNCGGDSSLMNRQTLTASAWIKADSFSRGDGYNLFMVVCLEQAVSAFDWGLRIDSGYPSFYVYVPTGYKSATPASTISTGDWYHVAGTWDRYGGSDNLKIYVDGDLKATNTVNENLHTYGTQVSIGRELHPTVNQYFDGAIDDVMIFDRELSSDEIEAIYNRWFSLDWDDNGNMTTGVSQTFDFNWDNKLRSASALSGNIKYDPSGNRVSKQSDVVGDRKYIVDIVGDLPTILMEMTDNTILRTYIYANGQPLCQHDGDYSAPRYFYIHNRLGSTRQIINTSGSVVRYYTYEPFGEVLEEDGTLTNYMMFTGQYFDTEIDQYYMRARQYDPHISRFTARDPIRGKFEEPMTLHVYLYCRNDAVNKIDPWGLLDTSLYIPEEGKPPHYNMTQTRGIINYATWWVAAYGPYKAHRSGGRFDYKVQPTFTFRLRDNKIVTSSEFGNYLTGYTSYYNYGILGWGGAIAAGESYGAYYDFYLPDENMWDKVARFMEYGGHFDDWGSRYWILRGSLDAQIDSTVWWSPLYSLRRASPNFIVESLFRKSMIMCEWFAIMDDT